MKITSNQIMVLLIVALIIALGLTLYLLIKKRLLKKAV